MLVSFNPTRRIRKLWQRYCRWQAMYIMCRGRVNVLRNAKTCSTSAGPGIVLNAIDCSAGNIDVQGSINKPDDEEILLNVILTIGPVTYHRVAKIEDNNFRANFAVQPSPFGRISVSIGSAAEDQQNAIVVDYEVWQAISLWRRFVGFCWFYSTEILPMSTKFLREQTRFEARQTISKLVALDKFSRNTKLIDLKQAFAASIQESRTAIAEFTVVVPVFNSFAHVARLLGCLRATQPRPTRIIIIDDCSTDCATRELLAAAQNWPEFEDRLKLVCNPVNLGFVKSANIGIAAAIGDVILLNTDVALPSNWVDRLLGPIAKDQRVASVTPFSNAATICSFPVINIDNMHFAGLTVDQVDAHFAALNPAIVENIDLPTGVGFCMAMNRKFIDIVGYFDEQTFGFGYGEENDWCRQAAVAGGRNALAANLYVLHEHGGTFEPAKKAALIARNLPRLNKKHNSYNALIANYLLLDPASALRASLLFRILAHEYSNDFEIIVDHDLGGGSNAYRQKRITNRARSALVSALASWQPEEEAINISFDFEGAIYCFKVPDWSHLDALVPEGRRICWFLNSAVGNTRLAACLSYLAERADKWANRLTIGLHDYYPLCPSLNLLSRDGVFCGLPDLQKCSTCLPSNQHANFSAGIGTRTQWLAMWSLAFAKADEVMVFSESSAKLFRKVFPQFSAKITMRPHAEPLAPDILPPIPCRMKTGQIARIAVVGSIGYSKGAAVVAAVAKEIKIRRLSAKLVVIGKFDAAYDDPGIEIYGPYVPEELPAILREQRIHVAWVPSICPETYCFVADELMAAGVPLACFNIGAPPERISHYNRGLVLTDMNPAVAIHQVIDHARSYSEPPALQVVRSAAGAQSKLNRPEIAGGDCI